MDKNAVRMFAGFIGTKIDMISSQGWAQCKCPLARWLHDSGKDSNPSAAIKVVPGGISRFTCFTCESHDLSGLLMRMRELGAKGTKYNFKDAMKLVAVEEEESLVPIIKDYEATLYGEDDDGNNDATFPEEWLASFVPAYKVERAVAYLRRRGLSDHLIHELDIRWDSGRRTVCFPLRDQYGTLCGLRGRRVAPTEDQPSYHMYKTTEDPKTGRYNRRVWLGENTVDWERPVVMVESVFDYAAVLPVYANVVAPLTVGMSDKKVRRMAGALDIVTLFDKGTGGNKARKLIDKHLPGNNRKHLIPGGPSRADPSEEATDPGEMRMTEIYKILEGHVPLDE